MTWVLATSPTVGIPLQALDFRLCGKVAPHMKEVHVHLHMQMHMNMHMHMHINMHIHIYFVSGADPPYQVTKIQTHTGYPLLIIRGRMKDVRPMLGTKPTRWKKSAQKYTVPVLL